MRNYIIGSKAISLLLLSFFCLVTTTTFAQRQAIDRLAYEANVDLYDPGPEVLTLGRRFIRMDSTYYLGYFYEGCYRFNRAADTRGFRGAIKPLRKALELMIKDYDWRLVRYTNRRLMFDAWSLHQQYCQLISYLERSYQNIEEPAEAVELLHQLKDRKLVAEFWGNPYSDLSWIYMRNRMHYEKFDFLESSIEANVKKADLFLDSIWAVNERNVPHLQSMLRYPDGFINSMYNSIYHYKEIIHSYSLNIDSAEYYAEKMKSVDRLSDNNYANLQFVKGDFNKAIEHYEIAKKEENRRDKSFREFDYMLSAIKNFRGEPQKGVDLIKRTLDEVGATPGYGWYNLGLARSYYYSGDLEKSRIHQDRASKFEELHIGTSHGETMYERSTMVLKYLNIQREMKSIVVENSYFWMSLKKVFRLIKLFFEQKSLHLLITI